MRVLALAAAGMLLTPGCRTPAPQSDFTGIKRGDVNFVDVRRREGDQPGSFWTAIANESAYPVECRRMCVFELFRRYAHSGMTLAQLAVEIRSPEWLKDADLWKET